MLLTVLTTKIRPSEPQVREEYMTSFMHIFSTVDGKNSFNISIGLVSVQVTYALLHLRENPRFVNPRSKGIASA
jgi:hypothetical protein